MLSSPFCLLFCSRLFVSLFLDETAAALNKQDEDNLIGSVTRQNKVAIFKKETAFYCSPS